MSIERPNYVAGQAVTDKWTGIAFVENCAPGQIHVETNYSPQIVPIIIVIHAHVGPDVVILMRPPRHDQITDDIWNIEKIIKVRAPDAQRVRFRNSDRERHVI